MIINNKHPSFGSVILVDTHQLAQIPHLKNAIDVVEVWDHHPDGDTDKLKKATIHNYRIGAIASKILDELYKINILNKQYAILLGSAILSNTIKFNAPSTTQYDRDMFTIAKKYFDFNTSYINVMFKMRDQKILKNTIEEILLWDMKKFLFHDKMYIISQIKTCFPKKLLNSKIYF